ncbi:MAG: DUF2914 domain-containing protein [Gammaproteobacteria bacterium]|nr:DUF2914 domain-containing protein [Gammaproteobacteria bacterium]
MMRHLSVPLWGMLTCCFVSTVAAEPTTQEGYVARALFTSAVENREPVDEIAVLGNDVEQIYFFTDLRFLDGQTIHHRWEYDGAVIADISFSVEGPRWRIHSSKRLDPRMLGKWTAYVVDESGVPLKASIFQYVEAEKPTADDTN